MNSLPLPNQEKLKIKTTLPPITMPELIASALLLVPPLVTYHLSPEKHNEA